MLNKKLNEITKKSEKSLGGSETFFGRFQGELDRFRRLGEKFFLSSGTSIPRIFPSADLHIA